MLAIGAVARVVIAFTTVGSDFDIQSLVVTRFVFSEDGFDLYGIVNAAEPVMRWPYPPGFIPAIFGADGLANLTGLPFHGFVQLPQIAADLALAWLAQSYLGTRGATERMRLIGAGLIALGPIFILTSGYHGQIDSLAILPAVGALIAWEAGGSNRALRAGVLIGLGAAIKIVPGFILLALLPSARSRREAGQLIAAAIAIPVVLLAPFLIADPAGVKTILEYKGGPGFGGLTLALQPGLAEFYVSGTVIDYNSAVQALYDRGVIVNVVVLGALFAFLARFRPPPLQGSILVWLALWSFGTSFFFHYLLWGLPFIVMAGYFRAAALLQIVALVPALIFYAGPYGPDAVYPYAAVMLFLWIGMLAGLVVHGRKIATRSHGPPAAST